MDIAIFLPLMRIKPLLTRRTEFSPLFPFNNLLELNSFRQAESKTISATKDNRFEDLAYLTSILSAFVIASANEVAGNRLIVSGIAVPIIPNGH